VQSPEKKPLYLSLETDDEFRARLRKEGWWCTPYLSGDQLDKWVWDNCAKQRRLIERG
jgi:hypothetical protein